MLLKVGATVANELRPRAGGSSEAVHANDEELTAAQPHSLTELACRVRGLTDADMVALSAQICARMAILGTLTSIGLSHNKIADEGAAALARALARGMPVLRRLELEENAIGDPGMASLADAMRPGGAPGLAMLRIGFNQVGDVGMLALARAWTEGGASQLHELHAASNCIGSTGLAALAEALDGVRELRTLSLGSALGGNRVDDQGAEALARALQRRHRSWGKQTAEGTGVLRLSIVLKNNQLSNAAIAMVDDAVRCCDGVSFVA